MDQTISQVSRIELALDDLRRAAAGAREQLSKGLKLTRTQLEIMLLLMEASCTTTELARRLFLTQSAVTQTIDTLVRRRLIGRHPNPTDRRLIQLQLSPAGRDLTDHLHTLRHQHMSRLANSLTSAEIDAFIIATEKFTALLNDSEI